MRIRSSEDIHLRTYHWKNVEQGTRSKDAKINACLNGDVLLCFFLCVYVNARVHTCTAVYHQWSCSNDGLRFLRADLKCFLRLVHRQDTVVKPAFEVSLGKIKHLNSFLLIFPAKAGQ